MMYLFGKVKEGGLDEKREKREQEREIPDVVRPSMMGYLTQRSKSFTPRCIAMVVKVRVPLENESEDKVSQFYEQRKLVKREKRKPFYILW